MNVLVFDIETIPDTEAGRKLYGLDGLGDVDVARAMAAKRREQTGDSEFLRHHLHRVVAISVVLRRGDTLNVWSLGELDATEPDIIRRFFDGIEKYTPTLVSWNGSGFDLPVLHYRCLRHGISAPRYWENGADDQSFRWNNYLSRFHERHTDLMDVLSAYQARAVAPLDEMAQILGFPGKLGMHGSEVWEQYQAGKLDAIRNYCETDVLNTYLIYLRYELMRGNLDDAGYRREIALTKDTLRASGKPHLQEFLAVWNGTN
jgi:predicted PolB exonuclease-like 3'-5' exonuclease